MTDEWLISVPGRVNLIGEHIDYHNLPVLPIAIQRKVTVSFKRRTDDVLRVESDGFGERRVRISDTPELRAGGDWTNYLVAAVQAVRTRWPIAAGFDASVTSDLPSAAGLSSSSALMTAFTLGLLRANRIAASFAELMAVLPEGEQFVGTRGGGMDHAAVLGAQARHALLVSFAPFGVDQVPIPEDWCFVVAHSLVRAEKSGEAKARFNACRMAGLRALVKLGVPDYRLALQLAGGGADADLEDDERRAFRHVLSETHRVTAAVDALRLGRRERFGALLNASHASLRDELRVSCPALDRIVEIADQAGADGARLTGAGFGGCVVILCEHDARDAIIQELERRFYAPHAEYRRSEHVIVAKASDGALRGG